jgi:hypothetical protein
MTDSKLVDTHGEELITVEDTHELELNEGGFKLLSIADEKKLVEALALAENALKYVDKLREFCLARSKPNDWTNQNGNPYFGEAGCNRFAAPFGMFERDVESYTIDAEGNKRSVNEKKAFEGDIKFIFFEGIFGSRLLGIEASFEGGSKLDDGFKSKDDILFYSQKGKANLRGRAYRKMLGMENVTWDELEKFNIRPDSVKKIERVSTTKAESEDAKKLWDILLELAGGDVKGAEDLLFNKTNSEKYKGKTRPSALSEKAMAFLLPFFEGELKKKGGSVKESVSAAPPAPNGAGNEKPESFESKVKELKVKLTQDEFEGVLQVFGVMNESKITEAQRAPFLVQLNKRVDMKGVKK